jgi:hypothetical protein
VKIDRADAQVPFLEQQINDWSGRNTLDAELLLRDGRLGLKLVLKEFKEPAPLNDWALIFGECIHNLRSSLDNLAFALARLQCDPPENERAILFPIFHDKAEFNRKGRRYLSQLPDEAATLIERLQPFQRDGSEQFGKPEDDKLLMLQSFNNSDKHQIPAVVLVAPQDLKINFNAEFYHEAHASENTPPNVEVNAGPLTPGVVLVEYLTTHELKSGSLQIEGSACIAISGLAEPMPIIPTIFAIQQYVKLVALQFTPFFETEAEVHN